MRRFLNIAREVTLFVSKERFFQCEMAKGKKEFLNELVRQYGTTSWCLFISLVAYGKCLLVMEWKGTDRFPWRML